MSKDEDDETEHVSTQVSLVICIAVAIYCAIYRYPEQQGKALRWEHLLERLEQCQEQVDCIDNVVRNLDSCFEANYQGFSYAVKLNEAGLNECLAKNEKTRGG